MIHRQISQLPEVGDEIVFIDEITYEQKVGIVAFIEYLKEDAAFVYIKSPDDVENDKEDYRGNYMCIIVYDDFPNETEEGIYKDTVLGNYGKIVGEEN